MICHTETVSLPEPATHARLLTQLSRYLHTDRTPAFTALEEEPWRCPPTYSAGAPRQKDLFWAQQAGGHPKPLHTELDGLNTQDQVAAWWWDNRWNCRIWGNISRFLVDKVEKQQSSFFFYSYI